MNANTADTNDEQFKTTTTADTPDEAEELLASLDEGDLVRFGGDLWTVVETDGTFVEFNSRTGHNPGTTTLKASSGFRGSCAVTHGRGMGTHYSTLEHVEQVENDEDGESVRLSGVVRAYAEDEARAAFTGDETAEDVFARYSTVVHVEDAHEAESVYETLAQVRDERELGAAQERAVRRVRAAMVEFAAERGVSL